MSFFDKLGFNPNALLGGLRGVGQAVDGFLEDTVGIAHRGMRRLAAGGALVGALGGLYAGKERKLFSALLGAVLVAAVGAGIGKAFLKPD